MQDYLYRCFLLIGILGVNLTLPSRAFAQANSAAKLNPVAEQWILEQIALGKMADLQSRFPNEEDRVLSAEFLVKLLENPETEITRSGINIRNASFVGPIELDFITVDYPIWLEDCTFDDHIYLYESHFTSDLYLIGSTFSSLVDLGFSRIDGNLVADDAKFLETGEAANFNSVKVDGLVSFQNAEFAGSVDFIGAQIGITFDAEGAHFNGKDGPVSFSSMIVDAVSLTNARFWGGVNFTSAKIEENLYVDDTYFNNSEQSVKFNSIKVGGRLVLSRAKLWGPVDFINAEIGNNLEADEARFHNKENHIRFSSMKVDGSIFLRKAEFAGSADFIAAQVRGDFQAGGVRFNHTEKEVSFNSMKIDRSMFLFEVEDESELIARFAGPVNFAYVQIGSTLEAQQARFNNKERLVTFNSMKVNGSVFLTGAVFAGPVDFGYAQIGSTLEANRARFDNEEQPVTFNSMKVNGGVFLMEAVFAGPVDFIRAQTGSNFEANHARFNSKKIESPVNFESMQVEGSMYLNQVVFAGGVSFKSVEIRNNLEANQADFQSTDSTPSFNNMAVGQEASFTGTKFRQGANFDNAIFSDLIIRGMNSNAMKIPALHLNQTFVERKLDLESLEIQSLYSRSLVVRGLTNIRKANILDSADFENSQFGNLYVEKVNWPPKLENVNLGGMSYENIQMILESTPENDWRQLIALVNRSKYNAQTYTTLENYFSEQGYADRADEVYINYKRREFREGLDRFSMGWWWNLVLRPIGYGRRPGYVFGGALAFIAAGWLWVFRKPEGMISLSKREIIRPNAGHRGTLSRKLSKRVIFSHHEAPYSPFWYSLDLFIPFVDLGFDDKWAPRPHRKWAAIYAKLHMLAGWILIPIGLLAVTGVIK